MNIVGKSPSSSSSLSLIGDNLSNPVTDPENVTSVIQEGAKSEHEEIISTASVNDDKDDDKDDEDGGQTFYSVGSDLSSSPENSVRTQVKYLEKDSHQLSSSPTSGSSLNTSSSALSSYDNSPENPSFLYSFLFPSLTRRKSSTKEAKKRRSSSLRKVSIKESPETFFLERDEMNDEALNETESQGDLESLDPNSTLSSRKSSCSSRKSSASHKITTPTVSRRESVHDELVRSRNDSGSSIGSWRKSSTHSMEGKGDGLKTKGQGGGRRRSETINYEADNEVRICFHKFAFMN